MCFRASVCVYHLRHQTECSCRVSVIVYRYRLCLCPPGEYIRYLRTAVHRYILILICSSYIFYIYFKCNASELFLTVGHGQCRSAPAADSSLKASVMQKIRASCSCSDFKLHIVCVNASRSAHHPDYKGMPAGL